MSDIDWTAYKKKIEDAARAGLVEGSIIYRTAAEAKARDTFPGVTGATFAGVYAAVSGSATEASAAQEAIQEVLLLNPLHAETEEAEAPPAGIIRMWGSVPTDYIEKLEADPTHAFLARTLDEEQGAIQALVDKAIGGVA